MSSQPTTPSEPDPVSAEAKARILLEARPWIQRFAGTTIVIKYGGNAMVSEDLQQAFAEDMVFLRLMGIRPLVVHGGGPHISAMLERLSIPSTFRGGLRVTSPEAMEVVRMVLTGQVGRQLVGLINQHGPYAVGLSGEDGALLQAQRTTTLVGGEDIDLGRVGQIVDVNPEAVTDLLAAGRIPIISSIAPECGAAHRVLNINADTAAAALASALGASRLIVLTDVAGVYRNWPEKNSLLSSITTSEAADLLPTTSSGMRPKLSACIDAVQGGVQSASIVDGRAAHALLVETFTPEGRGTQIVPVPADTTSQERP